MKKLCEFDPLVIVLLERETKRYRTSVSAIIRAAVIDWLCRSYHTTPPPMFHEERDILEMRDLQAFYLAQCIEEEKHAAEKISNAVTPQEIYETIIDELFTMSKRERHTLYLKTQKH